MLGVPCGMWAEAGGEGRGRKTPRPQVRGDHRGLGLHLAEHPFKGGISPKSSEFQSLGFYPSTAMVSKDKAAAKHFSQVKSCVFPSKHEA